MPDVPFPLFHLTMDDVWVWDKNRPTRIIPRVDVHTSQDLFVETLKTDGDLPDLVQGDGGAR